MPFALKKCARDNNGTLPNSDSSSSSIKYDYDVNKIDDVFKKIVKNQLIVDGFDEDPLKDVISVTYSKFSSTITNRYAIKSEERDGMTCYFADKKMIGFYHIQKESMKGIESFCDRYYLKETGTLYVEKKFLNIIKKNFGVSRLVKKKETIECEYCV